MDIIRIDGKKARLNSMSPLSPDVARNLNLKILVDWTYHSNAIEGNTLTLAETKVVLEGIAVGGHPIREHFEVINHAEAIRFIEDLVVKRQELSEGVVKQIQYLVTKNILERPGVYRSGQVLISGSTHVPPIGAVVPGLMTNLLQEFALSWEHPIRKAAQLHHRLVNIHPFQDGNGRTARLLLNLVLMQEGYPPAIILKEDRLRYYETLNAADDGDISAFTVLVAEVVERMLDQYLLFLQP